LPGAFAPRLIKRPSPRADSALHDYDYVYKTYGKAFRSGSVEALETFRELYRQVLTLGNERSTIVFIEKFVSLLPAETRRKILTEFLAERRAMERRSPEENATRLDELLRSKKAVG
jgi:hypothetical protein